MALDAGVQAGTDEKVIDQLNTLTAGHANPATYGSADQEPSNFMTVDAFELVKNVIHIQESNLDVLRKLESLGVVTNTLSTSGPIVNTPQIIQVAGITNSVIDAFKPDAGEVWVLYAASCFTLDGATTMIPMLKNDDGTLVVVDNINNASAEAELNEPCYITSDAWLVIRTSDASSGNAKFNFAVARVR